jgi:glycosyltransferase involved in cell wall biosynthesis
MPDPAVSVVIATYNRAALLPRAIGSALSQGVDAEVLVVDDGSRDGTAEVVARYGDRVRYLRQPENLGVGSARNRGIGEARGPWVVPLDDDDAFVAGALQRILDCAHGLDGVERYPVLEFRTSGTVESPGEFVVLDFERLVASRGDLAPVINRPRFVELGLGYPTLRRGAEHILWLRVAAEHGIPFWPIPVIQVHSDAPTRMTGLAPRFEQARDFAIMQEETLAQLGDIIPPRYWGSRGARAGTCARCATCARSRSGC